MPRTGAVCITRRGPLPELLGVVVFAVRFMGLAGSMSNVASSLAASTCIGAGVWGAVIDAVLITGVSGAAELGLSVLAGGVTLFGGCVPALAAVLRLAIKFSQSGFRPDSSDSLKSCKRALARSSSARVASTISWLEKGISGAL